MKKRIRVIICCILAIGMLSGCKHEHEYGEWMIKEKPSCTEEGVRTRVCKKCNQVESESIPAQGHNIVDGKCTECGE